MTTTSRRLWILFVSLVGVCGTLEAAGFKSQWVEIRGGGVVGEIGGKARVLLELFNKTPQAVWVQVRMTVPAPNAECTLTKPIEPGKSVDYFCTLESVVPDADYSAAITVYRDEALTDLAETGQTSMRVTKEHAQTLAEYMAVPELRRHSTT
ncbi:MAG: hypothetical protein HC872_05100 [Gammaproteobacteria bacterium]|nr:hypothetical protein [Gammaproteobacteria bacterium]